MKIHFDLPLVNLATGTPYEEDGPGGPPLTYRRAVVSALLQQQGTPKECYDTYTLAHRIMSNDPVDLTVDEATRIKEACGRIYTAGIVGPIWELLED